MLDRAITRLLDSSEPFPPILRAPPEQHPSQGDVLLQPGEGCQHLRLLLSPIPGTVLGTPKPCIKPSLCNSPVGSLALE